MVDSTLRAQEEESSESGGEEWNNADDSQDDDSARSVLFCKNDESAAEDVLPVSPIIMEAGHFCVGVFGIPRTATRRELHVLFSRCKGYGDCQLCAGQGSRNGNGQPCAVVEFDTLENAELSLRTCKGASWGPGLPPVSLRMWGEGELVPRSFDPPARRLQESSNEAENPRSKGPRGVALSSPSSPGRTSGAYFSTTVARVAIQDVLVKGTLKELDRALQQGVAAKLPEAELSDLRARLTANQRRITSKTETANRDRTRTALNRVEDARSYVSAHPEVVHGPRKVQLLKTAIRGAMSAGLAEHDGVTEASRMLADVEGQLEERREATRILKEIIRNHVMDCSLLNSLVIMSALERAEAAGVHAALIAEVNGVLRNTERREKAEWDMKLVGEAFEGIDHRCATTALRAAIENAVDCGVSGEKTNYYRFILASKELSSTQHHSQEAVAARRNNEELGGLVRSWQMGPKQSEHTKTDENMKSDDSKKNTGTGRRTIRQPVVTQRPRSQVMANQKGLAGRDGLTSSADLAGRTSQLDSKEPGELSSCPYRRTSQRTSVHPGRNIKSGRSPNSARRSEAPTRSEVLGARLSCSTLGSTPVVRSRVGAMIVEAQRRLVSTHDYDGISYSPSLSARDNEDAVRRVASSPSTALRSWSSFLGERAPISASEPLARFTRRFSEELPLRQHYTVPGTPSTAYVPTTDESDWSSCTPLQNSWPPSHTLESDSLNRTSRPLLDDQLVVIDKGGAPGGDSSDVHAPSLMSTPRCQSREQAGAAPRTNWKGYG